MTIPANTRYLKIHDDTWKKLGEYAEKDHRTITNLVQKILRDWVREKERENEKK